MPVCLLRSPPGFPAVPQYRYLNSVIASICGTMRALTPVRHHLPGQVSPLISIHLPDVPSPNIKCSPLVVLTAIPTQKVIFRFRHKPEGSPPHPTESGSSSYGLPVRFRLLSTPPRGDAVTFSFGVMAYSDKDFHPADESPSRAHWFRLGRVGYRGNKASMAFFPKAQNTASLVLFISRSA